MLLFVLILISVLIFWKLFNEFGKTHKIVVNLSESDRKKLEQTLDKIIQINAQNQNVQNAKYENPDVEKLKAKFPDFSVDSFLIKTEEIFDAVFNAFVNSYHHTLKSLLTEDLYEDFAVQIHKREVKNLRQEILIKHTETQLEKIQILSDRVRVFVKFEVSQMSAMVDIEGVSFDNPKRLYIDVIHKWIFERAYDQKNWIVSKTSASEA